MRSLILGLASLVLLAVCSCAQNEDVIQHIPPKVEGTQLATEKDGTKSGSSKESNGAAKITITRNRRNIDGQESDLLPSGNEVDVSPFGKGLFLTINGKLYEGDWLKGFRHGFGTLSQSLENGIFSLEYRGEWVRGKPEGIGWRYYENGDVYFGFWRRGKRDGYGKMWYSDGTFYIGYWNMQKKESLGMFVQQNGNRYEGHWEGDVKHGVGRFYHLHTGQLQEGVWQRGLCVKSKFTDILIRQFCDLPTRYPIPPETLQNSRRILEESELWLKQRLGKIDKYLQHCIDQM